MMNDDKDFIDLDSTANWSKLDVKREIDSMEFDEETGKRRDYSRGFDLGGPSEQDILLDGLTSGLNYIPEEFLIAADAKKDEEEAALPEEERADTSWAYRTNENEVKDPELTVEERVQAAASSLEKALEAANEVNDGEKAGDTRTAEQIKYAREREEAIAKERARMQAKAQAKLEADSQARAKAEAEAIIQANIEARKKAREEAAAKQEAIIRANAEARKQEEERIARETRIEMEKAAEDMYKPVQEGTVDMFSTQMLEIEYIDELASENESLRASKEERIAASQKNMEAAREYESWADGAEDDYQPKKKKKKKSSKSTSTKKYDEYGYEMNFWGQIAYFFRQRTALDWIVIATGVLVIAAACGTFGVYSASQKTNEAIASFVPLGEQMETIGVAGSGKLVAVADASRMLAEMAEQEEQETEDPVLKEYDEKESDVEGTVAVTMSLTSVKKDLKIKFVNSKTKKLVGGHVFQVKVVDAGGKTSTASDDDKDGIIYLSSVASGKATVSMVALTNDNGVSFSTEPVTVTIKEKIEYKKLDVSDEIKTEKDINPSVEDTAKAPTIEGALTDTVEWVESTVTEGAGSYVPIDKSEINDPGLVSAIDLNVPKAVALSGVDAEASVRKMTELPDLGSPAENPDSGNPDPVVDPIETPVIPPADPGVPTGDPTVVEPTQPVDPLLITPTPSPAVVDPAVITPIPTPTVGVTGDNTTPLKDKSGNQLYVKLENGTYRLATYADYYNYNTFFKQGPSDGNGNGAKKYTGWQTINGNTYFYDKNGVPVTGEQVIQGAKYNFDSTGALIKGSGTMGIDVSKWNGNINWTAVKNSGVSFVIIRCGYRGSSSGAMIEDPMFKANIQGAQNAGLKVGIYFFSQAVSDVEAVEEASMTVQLIKNYRISYPVFLDVEDSGGRGDRIDAGTRTAVINAFCQTVKNSGYTPGVYANKSWLQSKMNVGQLNGCKIWLAQYSTTPTYNGHYDLWQYSSKGSIGGISGKTDMNLSYLGY